MEVPAGIADPPLTEESPLARLKRRRPSHASSKIRPKSSAEFNMAGLFKAFEYDVASTSDNFEDDESTSGEATERPPERLPCRYYCVPLCALLSMVLGIFFAGWFTNEWTQQHVLTNSEKIFALKDDSAIVGLKHGAVAADHEVCSEMGKATLQRGGNAVDAAVATTLCLGVANPASSGLGGGAFILIHSDKKHHEGKFDTSDSPKFVDKRDPAFPVDGEKITEIIDCRETAPGAATQDMYLAKDRYASAIGGLAIAVPGELRGLELAHARHGLLSWAEVLEPIIALARDGVRVSTHLAFEIEWMRQQSEKYGQFPPLRRFLTKRDLWDTGYKEGEILRNPRLADTLSRVAEHGSEAFYEGELAESIASEVQTNGGILTAEDMAAYAPVLRSPVYGVANGYTVVGVPPPSSGGATIVGAARFLSGYKLPMAGVADTLAVHRTVEAMRQVFAIRMSLSDPAYFANTTAEAVKDLTSGPYMEQLRKMTLDNSTLRLSQYGGAKWAQLNDRQGDVDIEDQHEGDRRLQKIGNQRRLARTFGYLDDFGTSHLSVVDKDGNSVGITSSVNQIFGSLVFSESAGVVLGNTMDDFGNPGRSNFYGLKPSEANFISPGKRPLSSMSPTMVFRKGEDSSDSQFGKLELVVGGSGGPKIITAVLQVIINYCFLGMSPFESVARARVHDQLLYHNATVTTTEKSRLEQGPTIAVSQRTKNALLSRGHDSLLDIDYAGTVQAIAIDLENSTLAAVSDIRKGGKPAGY